MSGFVFQPPRPASWRSRDERRANETSFRPRATTVDWVLPAGHQQRDDDESAEEISPLGQAQKLSKRKMTNLEKQLELKRVYNKICRLRKMDPNAKSAATLHAVLPLVDYKRLNPVWKELKLEECLERNMDVDDPTLATIISAKYPIEANDVSNAAEQKAARAKNNKHRRTPEEWKSFIMDMYTHLLDAKRCKQDHSIKTYLTSVLQLPQNQHRRVYDVWRELELNGALHDEICYTSPSIAAKIDAKYNNASAANNTQRNLSATSHSYFDRGEENLLIALTSGLAKLGYPLEKGNLQDLCSAFLTAELGGEGDALMIGDTISMRTIERIYSQSLENGGSIKAKRNVNPIDPKRAAQADPQVLNYFYHQLEESVSMLHELDPDVWPYNKYANYPPTHIYNTDEQGPNPTKLRNPVLIPDDMVKSMPRLFQNTREGDGKMTFHYSVANIVRADGAQCIPHDHVEGAPPPYVIISDNSASDDLDTMDKSSRDKALANQSKADTLIPINPTLLEDWYDDFNPGEDKPTAINKFGFQIRMTPSGSMLKRIFFDFLHHFVEHLPHDQGPNGQGVFLFLDWHSSRECPQSLLTALLKYNVMIFVLPSKTSIWSQPCDCGKNEKTAIDIAKAAHDQGMLAGKPLDYRAANKIFRAGLEANCVEQNAELARTGSNAVVSSFAKTGLYPMEYSNSGWGNAYATFGTLNQMLKDQKQQNGGRVPTIYWLVKRRPKGQRIALSENETALLRSFIPKEDFLDTEDEDMQIPDLLLASAIAEYLLGIYLQDSERNLNQPPQPTQPIEAAALKLVEYVGISMDDRVDTICTLTTEEIATHKLRTKLSLLAMGDIIKLRKRKSNGRISKTIVSIQKHEENKYSKLDADRRLSRSFEWLRTKEILDHYFEDGETLRRSAHRPNLTEKDKKKARTKRNVARKELNKTMYNEAMKVADDGRKKRNIDAMRRKISNELSADFASKLEDLLEREGSSLDQFHDMMDATLVEPYFETVEVTHGAVTKAFDITRIGSDKSAVSHHASLSLMELLTKLKGFEEGQSTGKQRKRRRGPGLSTQLGRSGWLEGILLRRLQKEEETAQLEKEKKSLDDEIGKLRGLVECIEELKKEQPDSYWRWGSVKGKKRMNLAKLFGVYKSGMKAADVEEVLKDLQLSKGQVDDKLQELKERTTTKASEAPSIIAEIREREDYLNQTAVYATESAVES